MGCRDRRRPAQAQQHRAGARRERARAGPAEVHQRQGRLPRAQDVGSGPGRTGPGPSRAPAASGSSLAQRLAVEGEPVLNVPAKMSAQVRVFGGGSGRKTDDTDAHAVALAGLRSRTLQAVRPDDHVTVVKLLTDRREQLVEQRIATVNRLHDQLMALVPGGAARRLTSTKAKALLSSVRPRDEVGKARKLVALELLADLQDLDSRIKDAAKRLAGLLEQRPSAVQDLKGFGPINTSVVLGEVADIRRFPSNAHFASYTGTAPIDASSRRQPATPPQPRRQPPAQPRAALRRGRPDLLARPRPGLLPTQARRGQEADGGAALPQAPALRRRLPRPAGRPRPPRASRCRRRSDRSRRRQQKRAREDTWGRLCSPARPAQPRQPALRTSHFPDPPTRTLRPPPHAFQRHLDKRGGPLPALPGKALDSHGMLTRDYTPPDPGDFMRPYTSTDGPAVVALVVAAGMFSEEEAAFLAEGALDDNGHGAACFVEDGEDGRGCRRSSTTDLKRRRIGPTT